MDNIHVAKETTINVEKKPFDLSFHNLVQHPYELGVEEVIAKRT